MKARGFTLLELMIVVAIIGVVASIAYPSYQRYLVKAHRSAAQQFMLEVANRQEQFMLDNRTYTDLAGLGLATPPADVSGFYEVTAVPNNGATPPTFAITATPKAGTIQAGESVLTLNSQGQKGPPEAW